PVNSSVGRHPIRPIPPAPKNTKVGVVAVAYLSEMAADTGLVAADQVRRKGRELAEQYASASPFPHIVIDDFLPAEILETCLQEFPSITVNDAIKYDRDQERSKNQF